MSPHCASSACDRVPRASFSLVLRCKAEKQGQSSLGVFCFSVLCEGEEQASALLKKGSSAALLSGKICSLGITSLKNLLDSQAVNTEPQETLGDLCLKDSWEEGGISAKDCSWEMLINLFTGITMSRSVCLNTLNLPVCVCVGGCHGNTYTRVRTHGRSSFVSLL